MKKQIVTAQLTRREAAYLVEILRGFRGGATRARHEDGWKEIEAFSRALSRYLRQELGKSY